MKNQKNNNNKRDFFSVFEDYFGRFLAFSLYVHMATRGIPSLADLVSGNVSVILALHVILAFCAPLALGYGIVFYPKWFTALRPPRLKWITFLLLVFSAYFA